MTDGQNELFNAALKWCKEKPRTPEEIAEKIVLAATKTYEMTREQARDADFVRQMQLMFFRSLLR